MKRDRGREGRREGEREGGEREREREREREKERERRGGRKFEHKTGIRNRKSKLLLIIHYSFTPSFFFSF